MRGRSSETAVLLDTCALIWLQNAEAMAPPSVAAIFHAGRTGGVFVSPISAWEIGLLCRSGTRRTAGLQFLPDAGAWFRRAMEAPGVKPAPFTPEIAIDASFLPGQLHNDPADRIIIATARRLAVPVVTRDRRIADYARGGYVAVIPC